MAVLEKIKLHRSYHGIPCLWESGGGFSHTGSAMIITDHAGAKKKALFIKKEGHLSCLEHALIPVRVGDHIITFSYHREKALAEVFEITAIGSTAVEGVVLPHACVKRLAVSDTNESTEEEWVLEWDNEEVATKFEAAINAATDKADTWHCREAVYCLPPEKKPPSRNGAANAGELTKEG